jgi:hypothetical protein
MVAGYVNKLVKTSVGVAGIAGIAVAERAFIEFLETGKKPDGSDDLDDFTALVLKPDGTVDLYCAFNVIQTTKSDFPVAIGSGSEIAVGAMMAGKTAEEAVAIACLRDCYSGGPISAYYAENGSFVSRGDRELQDMVRKVKKRRGED